MTSEQGSSGQAPAGPLVAYQGEPGAFSELAILDFFGEGAVPVPCTGFRDVTRAVAESLVDYGMLPVQNSIAGPVVASIDAIAEYGLHTLDSSALPIRLCLLALPGSALESLRTVDSHPVALRQCGRFLAAHPSLAAREANDTAAAARLVAESGDRTQGAIASAGAGVAHGLIVLREGIEDDVANTTRFVVVAREPASVVEGARPGRANG